MSGDPAGGKPYGEYRLRTGRREMPDQEMVNAHWRPITQDNGSTGYVNLDHVAIVLSGANGVAEIVWAHPRPNPWGGDPERSLVAADMTPGEFLGMDVPGSGEPPLDILEVYVDPEDE